MTDSKLQSGCGSPGEQAIVHMLRCLDARLDEGNSDRRRVLAALERIETQLATDSARREELTEMITQAMQDAADALALLVTQCAQGVEALIAQGGGSGEGASSDEVVGLLSPIASSLQTLLDRLHAVVDPLPPGAQPFRAGRPAGRGPVRR